MKLHVFLRTAVLLGALAGLCGATVLLPSLAQAQSADAERFRLEEEMRKLAARNAWAGVERAYVGLLGLKIELPFEDHYMGAQSARYLGKFYEVYARLNRARELDPTPEVLSSLETLDAKYGRVDIKGDARRRPELSRPVMPFAPDERKAVEYAIEVVAGAGNFKGMLPAGDYLVGSQKFTVTLGKDWQVVEVSRKEGIKREGLVIYKGPIAVVGPGYSLSAEPTDVVLDGEAHMPQPESLQGAGLALSLGYEVGFTRQFGVAMTFDYGGMFDTQHTVHATTGWLAAAIRPGVARIAVGPTYGRIGAQGSGVAQWFDRNQNDVKHPLRSIDYEGYAWVGGVRMTAGYGLLDVEPLLGVVEVGGQWQTDGNRDYLSFGLSVGIVPKVPRFQK